MSSKLLNVRMDQEMLDELKNVCGELEITVTDAIKLFTRKLIKERKLVTEEEDKTPKEVLDKIKEEIPFKERVIEMLEVRDLKKYEKMNEDIGDIMLNCYREFKYFLNQKACLDIEYSEVVEDFKNQKGEELKNKIIDRMAEDNFDEYKMTREDMKEISRFLKEQEKFEEEKSLDIMKKLKEENPRLYQELTNEYSYDISFYEMERTNCKTFNETKEMLEGILTPEEIKEYIRYNNEYLNDKTEVKNVFNEEENRKTNERFLETLKEDKKRYDMIKSILKKIDEENQRKAEIKANEDNKEEQNVVKEGGRE